MRRITDDLYRIHGTMHAFRVGDGRWVLLKYDSAGRVKARSVDEYPTRHEADRARRLCWVEWQEETDAGA